MKAPSNRGFLAIGAALLCVTQFPMIVVTSSNTTLCSLVVPGPSQGSISVLGTQGQTLLAPSSVDFLFKALSVAECVRETRFSDNEYCSGSQRTLYDNFYLQEVLLCASPRSFEHEPVHKPPQKRWTVLI